MVENIVEGCGAFTDKEFARFLEMSIRSNLEVEYELQLAHEAGALDRRNWMELTHETIEIRKMLCGLRRTVLKKS